VLVVGSLPSYDHVQPILLFELADEERDAELAAQPGASNTGPLSDIVGDWGGAYKVVPGRTQGDAPKAGQLRGDRMSLLESS
jgi:hypothetical protein